MNFRRFIASKFQPVRKIKRGRNQVNQPAPASIESLETRTLLSESATAQITLTSTTGTAGSPVYHYSVTVNDTGTTNIGTFWLGWVPGEDLLASVPSAIQDPSGWMHTLTGSGNSTDGSAIEWAATSNAITPGHSLTGFSFTSTDSPTALAANSPSHPALPATTAFVYAGAAFSDSGFQLVATPPPAATTAASTTTLVSSSPTSVAGVLVTLTATVAPTSGSGQDPTGTVTFTNNGTTIGSAPVGSGGIATLSTAALTAGTDQIIATYGGDTSYSGSASAALTQTVTPPANAPATTTTLTSSALAAQPNASVTLTATVAPGTTPTGTVNFILNGTSIGMSAVQADGTATLAISTLPTGSDSITATYNGDATHAASTSAAIIETISAPATFATTLVKSTLPPALVAGAAAHGTATISITNQSAAAVKGKTTFAIFASTIGAIDGSAVQLAKVVKSLNLKVGKKMTIAIPLTLHGSTLAAGTYTLFARATDPSGNTSDSSAGQSVTVAAAFVALSETVNKSTLPTSTTGGSKSHASVTLSITNKGNIITPGTTTVAVFATAAGVVDSTATPVAILTKPLRIKSGKALKVVVPVKLIPAIAAGSYTVVAQVTDPNHQLTSVTVGTLTITA